MNMQITHL